MSIWLNDKDRVKEYVERHGDMRRIFAFHHKMVDVFGEMHPTKRMLLHEFSDDWGDELDKVIEEAVKKYPDQYDFDLAYYYVKERLYKEN